VLLDNDIRLSRGLGFVSVFLAFFVSATLAVAQQISPDTLPPIHVQGDAQKGIVGLTPQQVRHAYGFDRIANQGEGQVIGIVDASNHPQIEKELEVFSQAFGLPDCTTSNGCFQRIYSDEHPGADKLWALEAALDVEWAHAIAPKAHIILVESKSNKLVEMLEAVDLAVQMGARVVSMSWGTYEFATESAYDGHFLAPGVTFVASSGDFGDPGFYPAASPYVTSVGGTTLSVASNGNYLGETAWSGSGGGISIVEAELAYQMSFQSSGMRGFPDVAYNADPNSGFAVYDSYGFGGWIQVGGTSAGAPQWAALIAIANSMRVQAHKLPLTRANDTLYNAANALSYSANYNDITTGTNGTCGVVCITGPGYDFVTGVGSPRASSLIPALQN